MEDGKLSGMFISYYGINISPSEIAMRTTWYLDVKPNSHDKPAITFKVCGNRLEILSCVKEMT